LAKGSTKTKKRFYIKPIFELFWENYSWDGQLGFASGYRRILTAIYKGFNAVIKAFI